MVGLLDEVLDDDFYLLGLIGVLLDEVVDWIWDWFWGNLVMD